MHKTVLLRCEQKRVRMGYSA